jgi:hypothetical protein
MVLRIAGLSTSPNLGEWIPASPDAGIPLRSKTAGKFTCDQSDEKAKQSKSFDTETVPSYQDVIHSKIPATRATIAAMILRISKLRPRPINPRRIKYTAVS